MMTTNFTPEPAPFPDINAVLGNTDIYLIDQILKGRYCKDDVLLDAGCGGGRNLHWFIKNGIEIYGIDTNAEAINNLKKLHEKLPSNRFQMCPVQALPFTDHFFSAIISSAVLHFAESEEHFSAMISEMLRVLQPGGSLFIRTATDIGIEKKVQIKGNGIYFLPDGTTRFLLTRTLLSQLLVQYPLSLLDEFKTVNVNDVRCMSTLMLIKTN